jgi:biotin transport system substrate-specific component
VTTGPIDDIQGTSISDSESRVWLRAIGGLAFMFFVAFGAHIAVPIPPFGVPQTLQTLAVVMAALCLGPKVGMASMAGYLLIGMIGVPLFADGEVGLGVILGQTGGYIVGFIACQPVVTSIVRRPDRSIRGWGAMIVATLAGHAVIFLIGVPWLYVVHAMDESLSTTWRDAIFGGFVVFIPGMILKSALAVLLGRLAAPWASRRIW